MKIDGTLSVGITRRGAIRKLLADAKFAGRVDSFEELKQSTRSTFYVRGACEGVWREAIGSRHFESLIAAMNQQRATASPIFRGL